MVIYKTKMFKNSFKKITLTNAELIAIATEVLAGQFEADLGGGVIKKRACIQGKGKSSGIRTIIFYKQGNNLFFADGWKKSSLSSKKTKEITDDELESYKDLAKDLLKFAQEMEDAGVTDGSTTKRIAARIKAKELQAKYKHPTPMTGEDIKRIREQNNISQSSLALILNMTKESVSKWERNEIKPNGAALRLLHLIDKKILFI